MSESSVTSGRLSGSLVPCVSAMSRVCTLKFWAMPCIVWFVTPGRRLLPLLQRPRLVLMMMVRYPRWTMTLSQTQKCHRAILRLAFVLLRPLCVV